MLGHHLRARPLASTLAAALGVLLVTVGMPWSDSPDGGSATAQTSAGYHDGRALANALMQLARRSERVALHELGLSPGGQKLQLLEIAPAGARAGAGAHGPAVLVIGDPLGTTPLANEAALQLAQTVAGTTAGRAAAVTWHIVATANPDARDRFFARPLAEDGRNRTPVDDDRDGTYAEDAPDDLDGDGVIATMLIPDPAGSWLLTADTPALLREADPARGEQGMFVRHSEGRDDDGDGRWNEDGAGGVVIGRNFPHGFVPWTDAYGRWAADQPESRALLAYAFDHPEISLILVLGEANSLRQAPTPAQQEAGGDRLYPIPRWVGRATGLDPTQQYRLDDLVAIAREAMRRPQLTANEMLAMIGSDAATEPDAADLAWWQAMAEQYRDGLRQAGLDGARLDPAPAGPGSLQEWGYYQFGVPSFAIDFWSVPLPAAAAADSVGGGGLETGAQGPRESARGSGSSAADGATNAVADTTAQQALAAFGDAHPDWRGLRPWSAVTLPDGREVQVGGPAPYALRTPPADLIEPLLKAQIPLLLGLVDWLPALTLAEVELDHRGSGVYQLTAYLRNEGRIPYPTAQGMRCRRPPPVAVTLSGAEVLDGRARQVVSAVPARGAVAVRWLLQGRPGSQVTVRAEAPVMAPAEQIVTLAEKGGLR